MLIKGLTESISGRLTEGSHSISPAFPCCWIVHYNMESMRNRTKYKDLSIINMLICCVWHQQLIISKQNIENHYPPPFDNAFLCWTDAFWFIKRQSSFCFEKQIFSTPASKKSNSSGKDAFVSFRICSALFWVNQNFPQREDLQNA